jgi:hypothetical protein
VKNANRSGQSHRPNETVEYHSCPQPRIHPSTDIVAAANLGKYLFTPVVPPDPAFFDASRCSVWRLATRPKSILRHFALLCLTPALDGAFASPAME